MKKLTLFLTVIFSLFLIGCSDTSPGDYLPLKAGVTWEYRLESPEKSSKISIKNEPSKKIKKYTAIPQRLEMENHKSTSYLSKQEDGIYRVATDVGNEPKPDASPDCLIKKPIQVGTSWTNTEGTHVVSYVIESISDTVSTAAGDYSDCLKIKATAKYTQKKVSYEVERHMWYAMGVGLIKTKSKVISKNGTIENTLELEAFTQD